MWKREFSVCIFGTPKQFTPHPPSSSLLPSLFFYCPTLYAGIDLSAVSVLLDLTLYPLPSPWPFPRIYCIYNQTNALLYERPMNCESEGDTMRPHGIRIPMGSRGEYVARLAWWPRLKCILST